MENEFNITELIEDYNDYKTNIVIGIDELVNYFRSLDIEKGVKYILDFSEGMEWLIHAHKYFVMNNVTSDLEEQKIIELLTEVNSALEKKDYFLVADIFEHEVKSYFVTLDDIENIN